MVFLTNTGVWYNWESENHAFYQMTNHTFYSPCFLVLGLCIQLETIVLVAQSKSVENSRNGQIKKDAKISLVSM